MAGRARVVQLLRQLERVTCRCPAHSNTFYQGVGALSSTDRKTEYAFEMASSNIRYGAGVSREIVMSWDVIPHSRKCEDSLSQGLQRGPPSSGESPHSMYVRGDHLQLVQKVPPHFQNHSSRL
uniref:Uncharacterized protein n=1 Tax=Nothobranchius furzeri TaxID=105023 RepID=A0A8C6VQQ7_NOTFU